MFTTALAYSRRPGVDGSKLGYDVRLYIMKLSRGHPLAGHSQVCE
jgi:hypothetical protein